MYDYTIYIGFAGSDDKVAYLKELGFDEGVNYKKVETLSNALQQTCPKGIDIFFDNVSVNNYLFCMCAYIFVYVCMYICMQACMYSMYVCMHSMYVCMYVCTVDRESFVVK